MTKTLSAVLVALAHGVLWLLTATTTVAHESAPTIVDLRIDGSDATITLRGSAEAFIAGTAKHDPSGTGATPGDLVYGKLRAADPDTLTDRFEDFEQRFREGLTFKFDGVRVPLTFVGIQVPEVGDPRRTRESRITYSANMPDETGFVEWQLAAPYGDTVLRLFLGDATAPRLADFVGAGSLATIDLSDIRGKTGWQTFVSYIGTGFVHIIPRGLDHILFVVGLFLLAARMRPLLWQVSMFTAAHTITLALGAIGWVVLPGRIVEPIIAASIAYVAIENMFTQRLQPWRPGLVFAFGLLHGLGFASVLGDFGLPDGQFVPALIGFNLGVEFGQITVIAACFALVGYWFRKKHWYHRVIVVPISLAIAIIALYWVVARTGLLA